MPRLLDVSNVTTTQTSPACHGAAHRGVRLFEHITTLTGATASLTTAMTGTQNDVTLTARSAGAAGNSITLTLTNPGAPNQTLQISVVSLAITASLATNGASALTTTASQLVTALQASSPAMALVSAALKSGEDGTGVVTALTSTPLSGGLDATLTTKIQVQDPTSGTWLDLANAVGLTKTAPGDSVLTVGPDVAATANVAVAMPLTSPFRVVSTLADASSATFSLTAVLVP